MKPGIIFAFRILHLVLRFTLHASRPTHFILLLISSLIATTCPANNITIANQGLGAQNTSAHTRIIQFDLSWENSWRDEENYDAIWVFLKYSSDGGATWRHGTLKTSGTNPSGFSQGSSGTGLDIIVPSDKKGAYLRRSLTGEGSVDTDGIQFVWDYGTDLGANSTGDNLSALSSVKIMTAEMVYIPEGQFYLGDHMTSYTYFPTAQPHDCDQAQGIGNYKSSSESGYQIVVRSNDVHALKIKIYIPYYQSTGPFDDSDNGLVGQIAYFYDSPGKPVSCTGIWFHADSGISIDQPTESNMNTNWPTGFRAFYYMRYEVSQAQYRDFLNTLTPTPAVNRYVGGPNISGARFGIKVDNGLYGCDLNNNNVFNEADDGECVPATCCSANDSLAYNDWAALRWVTEFEYEKAGRGPNTPVNSEFACGYNGTKVYPSSYTYSGTANEVPSNNGEDEAWNLYNIRGLCGPLRCGGLATSSSSRKKAGASYYGVLDLTGNVAEDLISVATIKGRSFTAVHGDGELTAAGYHDVINWPGGPDIPFEGGSGWKIALEHRAVAQRGGEWTSSQSQYYGSKALYLSSRECGTTPYHYNWHGTDINGILCNSHGLRGGRTAE